MENLARFSREEFRLVTNNADFAVSNMQSEGGEGGTLESESEAAMQSDSSIGDMISAESEEESDV